MNYTFGHRHATSYPAAPALQQHYGFWPHLDSSLRPVCTGAGNKSRWLVVIALLGIFPGPSDGDLAAKVKMGVRKLTK